MENQTHAKAQAEIEARLSDLSRKYWVLDGETLYVKNGADSQFASAYYIHTDPAGTVYWSMDSRSVTKKEFANLSGWTSDPAPLASTVEATL